MKRYSNYYLAPSTVLLSNLRLLSLTTAKCYAETKLPLELAHLPKLVYFAVYHCLEKLVQQEDLKALSMWYPPRTATDQMEFKKTAMTILLKLEGTNKVPRNFFLDKRVMDDGRVIDFLRYLSEFALRSVYLNEHGQLIQVGLGEGLTGQIQKYYPPGLSGTKVEQETFQVFQTHIELLKGQLLEKSTHQTLDIQFRFEQIISSIGYQNQVKSKLSSVPKEIFSQNRGLDRVQIMDKIDQIWRCLDLGLQSVDIGDNEFIQSQKEWTQVDIQWEQWLRRAVSSLKKLGKKRQQQQMKNPNLIAQMKEMLLRVNSQLSQLRGFKEDVKRVMLQ